MSATHSTEEPTLRIDPKYPYQYVFIVVRKHGVVYLDYFLDLNAEVTHRAALKLQGQPVASSFAEFVTARLQFMQLRARMAMGDILNIRCEEPMTSEEFTRFFNAMPEAQLEAFIEHAKF